MNYCDNCKFPNPDNRLTCNRCGSELKKTYTTKSNTGCNVIMVILLLFILYLIINPMFNNQPVNTELKETISERTAYNAAQDYARMKLSLYGNLVFPKYEDETENAVMNNDNPNSFQVTSYCYFTGTNNIHQLITYIAEVEFRNSQWVLQDFEVNNENLTEDEKVSYGIKRFDDLR
jgi:hypothetical protein